MSLLLPVGLREDILSPVGLSLALSAPIPARDAVDRTIAITSTPDRIASIALLERALQLTCIERVLEVSQMELLADVSYSVRSVLSSQRVLEASYAAITRRVEVSSTVIKLKRNDNKVPVTFTLTDELDGVETPVNLTGATAVLVYKIGETSYRKTLTVVGSATAGVVRYDFLTADIASTAKFKGEVEVTFGDSTILTYPNDGYINFEVLADLG